MANILLVEPDYRSRFPPLGLLKISSYYKGKGDVVTFTRGKDPSLRALSWHKIYISSLFTFELPRTVDTVRYYEKCVLDQSRIVVGGTGATLYPDYIRDRVKCTVIQGPLDKPGLLESESGPIDSLVPDYTILDSTNWNYEPRDTYFCRATRGCVRQCSFCAVPKLEPTFGYCTPLKEQIVNIKNLYGERQNIVLLDNNILAMKDFESIIRDLREEGFEKGAKRNGRRRTVDFNQGIDSRLITPKVARLLGSISLSPVRLAFDSDGIEQDYCSAITELAKNGFSEFTNYVMYNYNDTPRSLYHRLSVNADLFRRLGVRVTGFPMRYVPINDTTRAYVSSGWCWRHLRGIQCILHATHGMVSPNPDFFFAAFGASFEEFLEIVSMPDHYIIYRNEFKEKANEWRMLFRKMSQDEQRELFDALAHLNKSKRRKDDLILYKKYARILDHYYPGGEMPTR